MAIQYGNYPQPLKAKPIDFISDQLQQRLPKGFLLPTAVKNNEWAMLGGVQKIKQNMQVAIFTPVGTRLMQPDYGSLLPMMVFEFYNETLRIQMESTIRNALTTWVPILESIDVVFDETLIEQDAVMITINGRIRDTDIGVTLQIGFTTPDNTVLPSYLFMIQDQPYFAA